MGFHTLESTCLPLEWESVISTLLTGSKHTQVDVKKAEGSEHKIIY